MTFSIVDSVRVPVTGTTVTVESVDATIAELDIPVVSVGRHFGPPVFFQSPWPRGNVDRALNGDDIAAIGRGE